MKLAGLFAVVLLAPLSAGAQVIVSEIMYDLKTGADSGREWIEVFNAGSNAIKLTDWKFLESNTAHAIAAAGGGDELPSGGYAVIADDPAKFRVDWPGYGGLLFDSAFSLANAGEPIAIKTPPPESHDSDTVAYGNASGAAGDGNTLHRTSSTAVDFAPAAPDPGAGSLALIPGLSYTPSAAVEEGSSKNQDTAASTTQTTKSTAVSSYVPPPVPVLFVDAGGDRTVIVGADTIFDGRAYNRAQEDVANVRYHWNFGDGTTAEGASVLHHFDYPARYAVVLSVAKDRTALADHIVVTAEPARLAFTVHGDGGISIDNRSGRDLDLSRWIIRNAGADFFLPDESIVLAGESIRITHQVLGFYAGIMTELSYPNGERALIANTATAGVASSTDTVQVSASAIQPSRPKAISRPAASAAPMVRTTIEHEDEKDDESTVTESASQQAAAAPAGGAINWWLAALAFSAIAGGIGVLLYRERNDAWNIIEETAE